MFEVGETVVCVDIKPHSYSAYWDTRKSFTDKKGPKTISVGKRYDVVCCDKAQVTVVNDNGMSKAYRNDRFVSLSKDRRSKLNKICLKLVK